MPSHFDVATAFSTDLLYLVLDHLVGETATLARFGQVCQLWRAISLPFLLRVVDVSCHNNGRLPEHESDEYSVTSGVVMSDYSDEYRPANLVSRQRGFLRFMRSQPGLASCIQSFTWTLVWMDFGEEHLKDIDLETWDIFSRMVHVTQVDLASLHDIHDQPYIRQNPDTLFPNVTHLRLVGWMHRGLVKAILRSLDKERLHTLELDHLQDEGALPSGQPIPQDLATSHLHSNLNFYGNATIGKDLVSRQERGEAAILPGPMWFPLLFLRQGPSLFLSTLDIKLGVLTYRSDQRNIITIFEQIAGLIQSAKATLVTINIELGEAPSIHIEPRPGSRSCGNGVRWLYGYRADCFDLASALLHRLLPALTENVYPRLRKVDLKGFRILRMSESRLSSPPDEELTWQYIRDCPFIEEDFTLEENLDYREPFLGYDYYLPKMDQEGLDELEELLRNS